MPISAGTKLGRYEIRSKIGEGGMGEVYLGQDTKLDRKVALKILPADVAAHPDRMKRFVQEAKAASALNHPNIITIYEIDETDLGHFIATEFIDGTTLRRHALINSVSLVASLDIAIQIATALSAAHAAGIIHRDIKPDNVMVRHDGIVKVLDFGLAKLFESKPSGPEDQTRPMMLTQTGVVMGTVSYMSPEQARGHAVDARSDIWSFGVLLYELFAKRPPFDGPSNSDILVSILEREPAPLSSVAPNVPGELGQIITRTLRKNREERYQNIQDLLVDLQALRRTLEGSPPISDERTKDRGRQAQTVVSDLPASARANGFVFPRSKAVLAVAVVIAVISIVVGYFLWSRNRAPLTEKDTVLLADFVNTTGDATFDGSTLKQALAIQLRQTPFVNLLAEENVRETLRYMNRSPDERITKQIGSEICKRRGLKAFLIGSIASIGSNYAITLEAVNGQTGETIAVQQSEAERKEQVLKTLGDAALQLRKQLGESLPSLQKYNAPIEQATTSSLQALNVYSKGLEEIYRGDYKSALPLFDRAVELDPNFAEAYVWLSWTYANFGDYAKTAEFAEKAYGLRDHVTELEKLHIDEIYHLWVTGDIEKERQADELITRLYATDWLAHNCLMIGYVRIGRFEQAVAEGRAGLRVNSNESHLYWHLANALIHLNRFDEARGVVAEAHSHHLDHRAYRGMLYYAAAAQGNADEMKRQLEAIQKMDGDASALGIQTRTAVLLGRWSEAQDLYRRQQILSGQPASERTAASRPLAATFAAAFFDFCDPSSPDVREALSTSRMVSSYVMALVPITSNGSLCGDAIQAATLLDEQIKRYPNSLQVKVYTAPIIRAAIALQQNHADQAIDELNAAARYDGGNGGFWPDYLRGQAYLRLRRGAEAAAEFQKIIDHRGWDPLSPMYPLAYVGLARAEALQGDTATARKHYETFFEFWQGADQNLPVLIAAKNEYQKLS